MNTRTITKSLEEVEFYTRGELKLKTTVVEPPLVDVKKVRSLVGLSQKDFADRFGFSVATIKNWEQGSREPEGPARILLWLIEQSPKLIEDQLHKLRTVR